MGNAVDRRTVTTALLMGLGGAALGAGTGCDAAPLSIDRPDMVVAVLDGTALSLAARLLPTATPSDGSLRFTRCFAASPSTVAAAATAIHGRFAHQLGAAGLIDDIQPPIPGMGGGLAAHLVTAGYAVVTDEMDRRRRPTAALLDTPTGEVFRNAVVASTKHRGRPPVVVLVGRPEPTSSDPTGLATPVPLLVRGLGVSGTYDAVVSTVDIAPTLLQLALLHDVAGYPGSSLLRQSGDRDRPVFASQGFAAPGRYAPLRAVRVGSTIYLRRPGLPLPNGGEALVEAATGRPLRDGAALARMRATLSAWRRTTADHWHPDILSGSGRTEI